MLFEINILEVKATSSILSHISVSSIALAKQDISSDVSNLSRRWLEGSEAPAGEVRTPDLDTMDYEQYHQSLTQ